MIEKTPSEWNAHSEGVCVWKGVFRQMGYALFFESVGEALSLPMAEYTPPLRRSRLGSPMGELSARTG